MRMVRRRKKREMVGGRLGSFGNSGRKVRSGGRVMEKKGVRMGGVKGCL
ncbi:hypothetical protein [Cytobacillus oceanisediminis]|nr:hypothetical protein [Cytobacillus oceanisediminis]